MVIGRLASADRAWQLRPGFPIDFRLLALLFIDTRTGDSSVLLLNIFRYRHCSFHLDDFISLYVIDHP